MSLLASGGVLVYVALATLWDVRERRIPNWLSALAFLAALTVAVSADGMGLRSALLGAALGLGALLIPFVFGAVGAGDVKFAAAAGAWLGPHVGLNALLLGSAVGLFVALGCAAITGRGRQALAAAARLVWIFGATLSPAQLPAPPREQARLAPIPYAVPLGAGVAGAVFLARQGWLLL